MNIHGKYAAQGSTNAARNKPRGCATISPQAEEFFKEKRKAMAEKRMTRHARRVRRFKDAGDAAMAEHALQVGERAVIRYRKEGLM